MPKPERFEPLKHYNFSESGYALLLIPARIRDEKDIVYYTEQQDVLQAYQEIWVFEKEAVTYPFACNDGFRIVLSKNKRTQANYYLRMRCSAFVSGRDYWHVNKFASLIPTSDMRVAVQSDSIYDDLSTARRALEEARKNAEVVFIDEALWEHYDGYFFISLPNPNFSGRAPFTDWDALLKAVSLKIRSQYSNYVFDINLASYGHGKNYPRVTFRIHSQRGFFEQFDQYPVTEWGWQDLKPRLTLFMRQ
ncbi:MAG: hypothetical protein HEP71_32505 [Roseivirga sp.]|nr:hypothetical protein [Roseivirga sp.]